MSNYSFNEPSEQKDIKPKILIVEDDANITTYFSEILGHKYQILITSSGREAINLLAHNEINLAIVDYILPDISGMEVLKQIKRAKPSIPVLIITGYGDEGVAVSSFRYGAKDYIKKPFSSYELLNKIECILMKTLPEAQIPIVPCTQRTSSLNKHLQIQKAINYIDENFMIEMSRSIAAEKACMSENHFSKVFREAMNITYQDYLNKLKIEKAKKMLRNSRLTITDIALSVGFNDITHFGRIFKKTEGVTPSEYRTLVKDKYNNLK